VIAAVVGSGTSLAGGDGKVLGTSRRGLEAPPPASAVATSLNATRLPPA
jgi:hypothetical protein